MWDKIEIKQEYGLGFQKYCIRLEFDLENKKAKVAGEEIIQNISKDIQYRDSENKEIISQLMNSPPFDEFELSDDDIFSINWDIKNVLEGLTDNELEYYDGIGMICHFIIKTFSGDSYEEYHIINDFNFKLIGLARSLSSIFGFDVFYPDLTKLITPYKYDIYHNGIFCKKTGEKLKLNKINFHISANGEPHNPLNVMITADDECFNEVLRLIKRYRVFRWYHKDYLDNVKDLKREGNGNSWICELIFDDGKVLNLSGNNAYPDTYIGLGQEILNLTDKDYLRIDEINNKEKLVEYNDGKLSVDENGMEMISIHQHYNTEPPFFINFIIDFKSKKAYWDINPDLGFHLGRYRTIYDSPCNISFDVFEKFYSKVSVKPYELDEDKIREFFEKLDFMDTFPIYSNEKKYCTYNNLDYFFRVSITSSHPYGIERDYLFEDKSPQLNHFGKLVENLIGVDILNIHDLKYLKSNSDLKEFWGQENSALVVEKMRFKHQYLNRFTDRIPVDVVFDFGQKRLKGVFKYDKDLKTLDEELTDKQINHIVESMNSNDITKWNLKDYQKSAHAHKSIKLHGYDWRLDLKFTDESILSFSGTNEHPDTYPFFAMDILNITGYDILRLDRIYYDDLNNYKKYGLKQLKFVD